MLQMTDELPTSLIIEGICSIHKNKGESFIIVYCITFSVRPWWSDWGSAKPAGGFNKDISNNSQNKTYFTLDGEKNK